MSLPQWAGGISNAFSVTQLSGLESAAWRSATDAPKGAFAALQYMQPPGQGQQGALRSPGQDGQRGFPQPVGAVVWLPSRSSAQVSESQAHVASLASQSESLRAA
jgi:hypothetical protein